MKINKTDLVGCAFILSSLALIPNNIIFWLTYALGCLIYSILLYEKKLYFGVFMNMVAIIIAINNFIKGV